MPILFALISIFAAPAQASSAQLSSGPWVPVPWTDVMTSGIYYLTQDLKINEKFQFPEGAKFNFVEVMGSGGYAPVTIFELQALNCPDKEMTEDIFLINPTGKNGEEVAVELRKECRISFYVDDVQVGRPSIFTDSPE